MVETLSIAIHFADDTVGIMQYVVDDGHTVQRRSVTSVDIDAEIQRTPWGPQKLPVQGWKILPGKNADVPSDRSFRDSWTWREGKIVHDMTRAKSIHRDRLREVRRPMLEALDVDYLRAQESGNSEDMARIVERKQKLRDITKDPQIDQADTIDQLKAHKIL